MHALSMGKIAGKYYYSEQKRVYKTLVLYWRRTIITCQCTIREQDHIDNLGAIFEKNC